jgi:hypothetical protein
MRGSVKPPARSSARSPSPLVGEGWGGGSLRTLRKCSIGVSPISTGGATPLPNPPPQGGREWDLRGDSRGVETSYSSTQQTIFAHPP